MRKFIKFLFILTIVLVIAFIVLTLNNNLESYSSKIENGFNTFISAVNSAVDNGSLALNGENASSAPQSPSSAETASDLQDNWGQSGMSGIKIYEYGKSLLASKQERSCYDQIAAAVLAMNGSVKMSTSLEPPSIEKIYKYYFYDHVENFYLNHVSMAYSFINVGGAKKYKSYTLTFTYSYDKGTATSMRTQMGSQVAKMLTADNGKTVDEAKERALHDALVNALHYNNDALTDPKSNPDSFTAYGAFINNSAVCDGYAKAMKILLNAASIKAIYVSGSAANNAGSGSHAWNMVMISEKWYYLDATFDDPVYYNSKGQYVDKNTIDHTYFNYTSSDDHVLGTYNASDPFAETSENYETMPSVG